MLQPKRTKFRKMFKGRIKGEAKGGSDLNFGTYGLKALQPERVTARQIEAARRAMTRHMKRLRKAVACACWERSASDAKKPNTRKAYYSAFSSESTSSPLLFQYLEEITVLSL